MRLTLAMFGEAEKGSYKTAYFCKNLDQLEKNLGNPPPESSGLHLAVQALLYDRELIFFRVEEEGFSKRDYLYGLHLLETQNIFPELSAIALPGVGNLEIIDATRSLCHRHRSILIVSEADLYDYLTAQKDLPPL